MANLLAALLQGVASSQGYAPPPPAQAPSTQGVAPPSAGQTPPIPQQPASPAAPPPAQPKAAPPPTQTGKQYVDPSGKPVDPNATAEVDPIEVTAPPKPKPNPAPINYDNTKDIAALQQAQQAAPRVDGGTNQGLWGMLPHQVSHGALRDVLGAIGDGLLMHEGKAPEYQNRVNEKTIGQAMAGYANNPQAAIERMAASGAPGAAEMAAKMQEQYEQRRMREAYMEQNDWYHHASVEARNQGVYDRQMPLIGAMFGPVNNEKDPTKQRAAYGALYQRADQMAKRLDPKSDATTAYGLPSPDDWQPGMTANYGMTANNVQQSSDRAAQRQTSMRNTDVNAGARVRAAGVAAQGHQLTSVAGYTKYLTDKATAAAQGKGPPLSADEQQDLQHYQGFKPHHHSGGNQALPPGAMQAYQHGTPQQRAAAKAKWASQGFNVSGLP